MYGRRRYNNRRRGNYIARPFKKYSVENMMVQATLSHTGSGWEYPVDGSSPIGYYVVSPAQFNIDAVTHTIQGTRKAKNFSISFLSDVTRPILWALVYKPEGVDIKALNASGGTIYEPNQNIICTGIFEKGQQSKWITKLGRNLNSGDSVVLLVSIYSDDATDVKWGAQITYAIAF